MFQWLIELWRAIFGDRRIDDIPDSIAEAKVEEPPPPPPPPPKPSYYAEAVGNLLGSLVAPSSRLHYKEIASLRAAAKEMDGESVLTLENARVATVFLQRLWDGDKAFLAAARSRARGLAADAEGEGWRIALCQVFLDQLEGAEQSFKGRILQAIRKLANSPGQNASRLAEPLGPENGPWVQPIGKARLLYQVDEKRRVIFLLAYS